MKKYLAILTAVLLICSMTAAFALNWAEVETDKCTEYVLTAEKYVKTAADVGRAYTKAPAATAKLGEWVYFTATATDADGDPAEAKIEYHHLANVQPMGNLYRAKVIGPKPYVKISITEKTPLDELTYKNERIHIEDDTVYIGNLVFWRNANGMITDVECMDNVGHMLDELAELGITVTDIYEGKVCMTDDILISNFGKVCHTEKMIAWYDEQAVPSAIPKTGDMTVTGIIILALVALAALSLWSTAKRARR